MRIKINMTTGKPVEQVVAKDQVIVGRSLKCDIVVPEEALSRQHCQIDLKDGEFFVTDLGSANGVFLDGVRIPPQERTPFSSFLVLHLGPLECQVWEETGDIDTQTQTKINPSFNGVVAPPRKRRSTDQVAPPAEAAKASPLDIKLDSSKLGLILSGVAFIGIVLYFVIAAGEKADAPPVAVNKTIPKAAAPSSMKAGSVAVSASNSFLTSAEYLEMDKSKSCREHADVCKDLSLNEAAGEGVVQKQQEFFVFKNPSKHAAIPGLEKIKDDPTRDNLIAVYQWVRSTQFTRVVKKEISQLHLIVKNAEGKPVQVMRFHPQYFTGLEERMEILKAMAKAIKAGESASFWTAYRERIPVLDL